MKIRLLLCSVLGLMLVACSTVSEPTSATPDDGTVNGRMVEDAGGDGTNTTGGAANNSAAEAQRSFASQSFSSQFPY